MTTRVISDTVPLVVDLDGTLTPVDTLHESLVRLCLTQPSTLWRLPAWLNGGKAAFKREVAERSHFDAARVPYNELLLERLQAEHSIRSLVLCTAADQHIADAVAKHLGIFDSVLASDGRVNLGGRAKAERLVREFGLHGFDYAGNSSDDLPVFGVAREAWTVTPTLAVRRKLAALTNIAVRIDSREARLRSWWRSLRPHQWAKNALVFVPMLTAVGVSMPQSLMLAVLSFFTFSALASSVYIVNDLIDLDADRIHPRKRFRPLASGSVGVPTALATAAVLFFGGFALAWSVRPQFGAVATLYVIFTSLYMLWLKRVPLLDTIVLASLYTLRIIGGAAAIDVEPSFWLLAFSVFFFLSLALGKRHSELVELQTINGNAHIPGREYRPEDLVTLISQGTSSGYAAVVVLALYINGGIERNQYHYPELLALICLLLLYWINKFWLNSQRREIQDDPVIWALTNRVSRGIAVLAGALLALARWLPRPGH